MNKILKKYTALLALPLLLAVACEDDDNTGHSNLTPSNPTVTVAIPNPQITLAEKDSTFEFTITLSEPQIVDVMVYINVTGGTATLGEDFTIDNTSSRVLIPAYRTSGKASITVKGDNAPEEAETFKITFGDGRTANASITPVSVEFTIQNVSANDLPLALSWGAEYFDAAGEPVAGPDLADLVFTIHKPNGTATVVDGAAFESFVLTGNMADGEYILDARYFAVIDPGQLGAYPVLDLDLEFSQVGKIAETTLSFPAVLDGAAASCDWNVFKLAKITKSGTNYTVEPIGAFDFNLAAFTGAYNCDEPGYKVYPVNFTIADCETITNDNFWDAGFSVDYVFDADAGTVTIPTQEIDATPFGLGKLNVEGTGTFNTEDMSFFVDYVITSQADGSEIEAKRHTFTK
jgi:hypothetical protein